MAYKPTGSSKTKDGRVRAQISYEGEDEFSSMSLEPERREKDATDIDPLSPGNRKQVHVDEIKPQIPKKKSMLTLFRKIFAK